MSGYNGETVNSIVSKLYRKSDFNLEKAQRGIVFLDGMDQIGVNGYVSNDDGLREVTSQQVFKEILSIVEGTKVDVSRIRTDSDVNRNSTISEELFDTSNLFFVCFGVAEDFLYNKQNTTKLSTPPPTALTSLSRKKIDASSDSSDDSGIRSGCISRRNSAESKRDLKAEDRRKSIVDEILSEAESEEYEDEEYDDYDDYLSSAENEDKKLARLLEEAHHDTPYTMSVTMGHERCRLKVYF